MSVCLAVADSNGAAVGNNQHVGEMERCTQDADCCGSFGAILARQSEWRFSPTIFSR